MLTGKCKEDFEKWFRFKSKIKCIPYSTSDKRHDSLIDFYDLSFSMQYGVYVDFFSHFKIEIDIIYSDGWGYATDIDSKGEYTGLPHENTRQEARTQAILKANEIYNSR